MKTKNRKRKHRPSDFEPSGFTHRDYKVLYQRSRAKGLHRLNYILSNSNFRDKKIMRRVKEIDGFREKNNPGAFTRAFTGPFEDLPLLVGNAESELAVIAQWRMEIGK